MSVIAIDTAMRHLRAEEDDRELVQLYLDAAEERVEAHLQRRFYADEIALEAARATVPALRQESLDRYRTRTDTQSRYAVPAGSLTGETVRLSASIYQGEIDGYDAIEQGLVINKAITSACLLILGHLYENRENTVIGVSATPLPMGALFLLEPYRAGLGV